MADDNDDSAAVGAICCCWVCLILILTIPVPLISISMKTHNPRIYVKDLYIPALNGTAQSNATRVNTFFFVDLQLRNVMRLNGLRYEGMNVTFFYGGNRSFPVADFAVAGFYQGVRKSARRREVVRTHGLPWEDAFDRISRGLTVDFAVEVAMTVKLRRCGAYMKRKVVVVAADVSFDGSGDEVDGKPIRLR